MVTDRISDFKISDFKISNFKIFRISKFFEFQGQPFPAPLYSVHRMNVLWLLIGFQNFLNFKIFQISICTPVRSCEVRNFVKSEVYEAPPPPPTCFFLGKRILI